MWYLETLLRTPSQNKLESSWISDTSTGRTLIKNHCSQTTKTSWIVFVEMLFYKLFIIILQMGHKFTQIKSINKPHIVN